MKRLSNLTIMSKLLLAFASMIVIIAGIGAATYLKLGVREEQRLDQAYLSGNGYGTGDHG